MKQLLYFTFLFSALLLSCQDDKDTIIDPFKGTDNFIRSLSLAVDDTTYQAVITGDSITLCVPPAAILSGAVVSYELAELTSISPEPESVENWEQAQEFTVTSHSGEKRTYRYVFVRADLESDGDVYLQNQAETDAFAQTGITVITGNLVLGVKNGEAITSLKGLRNLKEIRGALDFVNCGGCQSLEGLENLEKAGRIHVSESSENTSARLTSVKLPKLRETTSDFYISPSIQEVDLSSLERVGGDMYIFTSHKTFELPRLKTCNGLLTLRILSAENKIIFPELEFAAGMNISADKQQTEFPRLTEAGKIDIWNSPVSMPILKKCVSFKAINTVCDELPALETVTNSITGVKNAPLLVSVGGNIEANNIGGAPVKGSFPLLVFVGGSITSASCPLLTEVKGDVEGDCDCPQLQTICGTISTSRFKKLKNFPALTSIGGLKIETPYQDNGEEDEQIWDISSWQIGDKGVEIYISQKKDCPSKIIGPWELNGLLDINLSFDDAGKFELSGFNEIKSLSIYDLRGIGEILLSDLQTINENAEITCLAITLPALHSVGKHLNLTLNEIHCPRLTNVGQRFSWNYNWNRNSGRFMLDFPELETVGDNSLQTGQICFYLRELVCQRVYFPALKTVHGDMTIGSDPTIFFTEEISMPLLETIDKKLTIGSMAEDKKNPKLTKIDMKSLTKVSGITISNQSSLKDFSTFQNVISGLSNSTWKVSGCGYNPLYQDMVNGDYTQE